MLVLFKRFVCLFNFQLPIIELTKTHAHKYDIGILGKLFFLLYLKTLYAVYLKLDRKKGLKNKRTKKRNEKSNEIH